MSPPKKKHKCYGHSLPVYNFYVVRIISQKKAMPSNCNNIISLVLRAS